MTLNLNGVDHAYRTDRRLDNAGLRRQELEDEPRFAFHHLAVVSFAWRMVGAVGAEIYQNAKPDTLTMPFDRPWGAM